MPGPGELQRMSADLPEDDTFIITNIITVDAPLEFVWENLPKNVDMSQIMQPYLALPGVRTWVTSENFNETGSSITYTMTDGSTMEEFVIKRDANSHHYVYACSPRVKFFDFWQGNLFYEDSGNGKTTVVWRYWLKPDDKFLSNIIVSRLLKLFVWRGYTDRAASRMKSEIERLYIHQME
ncbi:hypothetical protein IFM60648_01427 [Aspergillus lentulus]|uniref:SRPBCC family protein n=1 Tax=Aspergillus lentulus TaxID=293939 RepID=A0ABQ0ZXZ6_ASPLE|nr:hypothetical protein IFM60648_01427 [Aspergillus lentulus]GFF79552.1 hypothetical protein IFM62136_10093 [Aspergillus lentulus]